MNSREYMRAWKKANPDKVKAYARKQSKTERYRRYQSEWRKQYRAKHGDRIRAARRAKYAALTPRQKAIFNANRRGGGAGLSLAQIEDLVRRAGGRCQICAKPFDRVNVDHCHKTRRVRGVLCTPCNTMLGYIEKRGHLLGAMRRYMKGQPK